MSGFAYTLSTSQPIGAGSTVMSPYQWAAKLAPSNQIVEYKNALLWIEGQNFGSEQELIAKVQAILKYQNEEEHKPSAPTPIPPVGPKDEDGDVIPSSSTSGPSTPSGSPKTGSGGDGGGWEAVKGGRSKPKPPAPPMTKAQLGAAIVNECVAMMQRTFSFTGPSLRISEVYPKFSQKSIRDSFTYPQLIGAVRDEIARLPIPSTKFSVPRSARYQAASSPGKGKNFNFKVQRKDASKPNGWSAVAQIHVLWE